MRELCIALGKRKTEIHFINSIHQLTKLRIEQNINNKCRCLFHCIGLKLTNLYFVRVHLYFRVNIVVLLINYEYIKAKEELVFKKCSKLVFKQ